MVRLSRSPENVDSRESSERRVSDNPNQPRIVSLAAPAKVVANDAQTGLKGLELKNAAADAKSGDDVSAALKARRSK